jgi:hypothetical protein
LRNVNVKYHEANIIPTDRLESISPFKLDMLDSINLPAASQSVDLFTRSANVGVSFKGYLNFPSDDSITQLCLESNGKTNVFIGSDEEAPVIRKGNRRGRAKGNRKSKKSKSKKSKKNSTDDSDEELCADINFSGIHEISVDFLKKGGLGHATLDLKWGTRSSMTIIPVNAWLPRPSTEDSADETSYHRYEKFNLTAGIDLPDIDFPLDESSAKFLRDNSNSISLCVSTSSMQRCKS